MIVYFANRNMEILGAASTGLPDGLIITDDEKTEDIESGHASLSLTVSYRDDLRLELEQMTKAGNYVLCERDGDAECYTVIDGETETKTKTRALYCEDAGLDLLNEICSEYSAASAMTIAQYVTLFAGDSGFNLGVNELPGASRKLSWDSESTATARLRSVATQFDAEMSYSYRIEKMAITGMYINIWKKRGTDAEEQLRLNRDIDNIRIKDSVANLITGLIAKGGTPEGGDAPITLSGTSYDDGDIFLSSGKLYCRSAARKYSRIGCTSYIMGSFSYETTSQQELLTQAVSYLKQHAQAEVNYECEILRGLESAHIGDRINIVDDKGEVYLSARILEMTTSVTQNKKTATLGEYLIRTSGISRRLEEYAAQFQSSFESVQTALGKTLIYDHTYSVSNGTASFTAYLYRGGVDVKSQFDASQFTWYYKTEDTETYLGSGYTMSVSLDLMGYGGEIIGRFSTTSNVGLRTRSNLALETNDGNRTLARTSTVEDGYVRIVDLDTITTHTTDQLLIVGAEQEGLTDVGSFFDLATTITNSEIEAIIVF